MQNVKKKSKPERKERPQQKYQLSRYVPYVKDLMEVENRNIQMFRNKIVVCVNEYETITITVACFNFNFIFTGFSEGKTRRENV